MAVVVAVDLGTSKITSLAVDTERRSILARSTAANDAILSTDVDRRDGRSEWDAGRIVELGCGCVRDTVSQLADRADVAGIGITGQQHGVVLVDSTNRPLSPLINWQDRRTQAILTRTGRTYVETARELISEAGAARTGCRLQPGFLGTTLFWLKEHGQLPAAARPCFIMDLFGATLTGGQLATEPTCAASSGLFDVHSRRWDAEAIRALGLAHLHFPEVREAHRPIGTITATASERTGLQTGTPVTAPIGDHQASFFGSIRDPRHDLLVNVGTGAQVAVYTDGDQFRPPVELRPFPIRGNLLSNVGLAGGWSYQILESFFQQIGRELFHADSSASLYETMNRLAVGIPNGCDDLLCDPHFSGTRSDASRRGGFSGVTPQNFTPAHFARAVLEGMARSLSDGYQTIREMSPQSHQRVVAAGNALRENAVLRESVSQAFAMPLAFTRHREEAAFGAALVAAIGAGVFASREEAATLIEYE